MNYTEEITSPLDAYTGHFRQANAEAAEAVLAELIQLAGIDVDANKSLCGEIHELEKDIKHGDSECGKKKLLRALLIVISLICGALPLLGIGHLVLPNDIPDFGLPLFVHIISAFLSAAGIWFVAKNLNPVIAALKNQLKQMQ